VPAIDEALGDGLPASQLTELVSAAPSSGGQLVLARFLETTRMARQRVALIDAADGFAPHAIPQDALRHLVWVRCRAFADALASGDVLVRDGNYAAVVIDLRGVAEKVLRKQPGTTWHRLHRVITDRKLLFWGWVWGCRVRGEGVNSSYVIHAFARSLNS